MRIIRMDSNNLDILELILLGNIRIKLWEK